MNRRGHSTDQRGEKKTPHTNTCTPPTTSNSMAWSNWNNVFMEFIDFSFLPSLFILLFLLLFDLIIMPLRTVMKNCFHIFSTSIFLLLVSLYAEVVHFMHERKRKINSKCRQINLKAEFVLNVLRRYQMMIIKCYLSQKCRGAEKNVEQNVGYLLTTTTNAEQFRLIYTNTCVDEWKLLKNVIVNNNLYIVYILVDAVL